MQMNYPKSRFRNQDKCILIIFLIVIIALVISVFLIPEQWIINATSSAISIMIYSIGLLIFRIVFSTDSSGKRRVRTGVHSSRWLKNSSYCISAAVVVIVLVIYTVIGHPWVVSWVSGIVIAGGRTDAMLMLGTSFLSAIVLIIIAIRGFSY